jgi:hypothetical protein
MRGTATVRIERGGQFLVDHVERVIHDRYHVTVIGSIPIKMQLSNSQEIETQNCVLSRGEIDNTTLHKKPRKNSPRMDD